MTVTEATPRAGRSAVPAGPATPGRGLKWAVLTLVAAPFVVGIVATLASGRPYLPSWDPALIELMVRDTGRHSVLLGPYSRFGWNHPGPALFYVLAIPYRIFGASSAATDAGALVVNGVAAVAIVVVARRRGGMLLAACAALVVLLCMRTLGGSFLRDPWNPYITVLPFALLVLLAWSVAVGDAWMLPWAVLVASFVVQTHVSYLIAGVFVIAAALVAAAVRLPAARRGAHWASTRRRWTRAGIVALVAALFVWAPTAFDAARHDGGNAQKIIDWSSAHSGNVGLADATRIVSFQWTARPEWLFGAHAPAFATGEVRPAAGGWVWLTLALGLVSLAAAALRGRRDVLAFGWILAAGFGAAVLATTRIVGPVAPYLLRWQWALGMLLGLLVLWSAALALRERGPRALLAPAAGVLAVAIGVVAVVDCVGAARAGPPDANVSARNVSLARQVLAHLGGERGPVYFEGFPLDVESALALALTRRHIAVRFAHDDQWVVGHWRTGPEAGTHVQLLVATGPDQIRALGATGDWHAIARWRTRASRRDEATRRRFDELLRAGRLTPEAFGALLQVLSGPPSDVAVFARFR